MVERSTLKSSQTRKTISSTFIWLDPMLRKLISFNYTYLLPKSRRRLSNQIVIKILPTIILKIFIYHPRRFASYLCNGAPD